MKLDRKKNMPSIVFDVGKRIKKIIIEKNLKLRHVAYDADLDVANLRKYIKGTQEMKISTLMRIVKALEVNVEDLLSNDT
jgi:predicted transcriptional regulator